MAKAEYKHSEKDMSNPTERKEMQLVGKAQKAKTEKACSGALSKLAKMHK